MSIKLDFQSLYEFYIRHLNEEILPFWLKNSIDREYGGFFTCFDNSGKNLISTDKYTWSQGRMVWVLSKLSSMEIQMEETRQSLLDLAASGAEFLMENCLLPNGNCTFVMDRSGKAKPQQQGEELDSSFYADCFAVLGLSKYAFVSKDKKALDFAVRLFNSIYERVQSGSFKSEPYPAPKGFRLHGPPMIMLNVSSELADALHGFGDALYTGINSKAEAFMHDIIDNFVSEDNLVHEMIDEKKGIRNDCLLGRYINPGHTIEDMWFIIHQARKTGNREMILKAAKIIDRTFKAGWDEEFGGLLLFADMEGGRPKGEISGFEKEKMVEKVLNDWSSKLWWPHSEALYSLLLAYGLTGDAGFIEMYSKVHEYTFNTFPNPDRELGEWIQIRDRQGLPEQKLVALPVKDPFHIARNIILIIELLEKMLSSNNPQNLSTLC